jgi:serine/threonine protein kinase
MHAEGIVHRDIKPGNILIDCKGRPVVVDFGVACDPRSTRLTSEATSPGTLRFMPPEQLSAGGAAAIDVRSDIYSLGVTLFELLTLMPAFPQEQMGSLIDAIRLGDRPRPRDVDRAIPKSLDLIVQKATALRPDDRYQSAAEMEAALRESINCLADSSELKGALGTADLDQALREGTWRGVRPPSSRLRAQHGRPVWLRTPVIVAGASAGVLLAALWLLLDGDPGPVPDGPHPAPEQTGPTQQPPVSHQADFTGTPARQRPKFSFGSGHRPGKLRKAIALEALQRMREFASIGAPSPLLSATTAFLEDRPDEARSLLTEIEEPEDPVARLIYWQLLLELGDPMQRTQALKALSTSK